jgi:hypothetical protein
VCQLCSWDLLGLQKLTGRAPKLVAFAVVVEEGRV